MQISINAQHFVCCICTELVSNNRECNTCHKLFCFACLDKWFRGEKKRSCPTCKQEPISLDNFTHNIFAQMTINSTEVECPEYGCNARLCFGDLTDHLANRCAYIVIACPMNSFGCEWKGLRSGLEDHKKECSFYACKPHFDTLQNKLNWKDKQYSQSKAEVKALKSLLHSMRHEGLVRSNLLQLYIVTEDDFKTNYATDLVLFDTIIPEITNRYVDVYLLNQIVQEKFQLTSSDVYTLWRIERRVNGTNRPYAPISPTDFKLNRKYRPYSCLFHVH